MISKATTPDAYIKEVPADKKEGIIKLREVIKKNLPAGFEEGIGYGMISYAVPQFTLSAGLSCAQTTFTICEHRGAKNFIALYHIGMYAMPEFLEWFTKKFPEHSSKKPDMGKSCIRFKKQEDIPYKLIGELMKKVTVKDWIDVFEKNFKKGLRE